MVDSPARPDQVGQVINLCPLKRRGRGQRAAMSSAREENKGVEALKNFERALGHVRNR